MNAHLIRIVEGPLAGDCSAANDAVFDVPSPRARATRLTLVLVPAENGSTPGSDADNAALASTTEQDDYVLGGYAGI